MKLEILCPECTQLRLRKKKGEVYCPGCGTEFEQTGPRAVKYKNKDE